MPTDPKQQPLPDKYIIVPGRKIGPTVKRPGQPNGVRIITPNPIPTRNPYQPGRIKPDGKPADDPDLYDFERLTHAHPTL
jgi:hypothetical protein